MSVSGEKCVLPKSRPLVSQSPGAASAASRRVRSMAAAAGFMDAAGRSEHAVVSAQAAIAAVASARRQLHGARPFIASIAPRISPPSVLTTRPRSLEQPDTPGSTRSAPAIDWK
jgi:hypothetical protein